MYETGDIVNLSDEEYAIISMLECNKTTYLYLTKIQAPIKVVLAKIKGENLIETVSEKDEIEYVLARFNSIN